MINIRPYKTSDSESIWNIFHAVIQGGDTYTFLPDTPQEEALEYFTGKKYRDNFCHAGESQHPSLDSGLRQNDKDKNSTKCFVAEVDGKIVGMYALRKNRKGLGDHIGNVSYMVFPDFHGRGVGKALGLHSIEQAKKEGYLALQFNFVVSTNTPAVNLWRSLGFEIIGTVPNGFRHSKLGLVDVYIMYRDLRQ